MAELTIGVDAGGTLTKMAYRGQGGLLFGLYSSKDSSSIVESIAAGGYGRVGLCGCGAARLKGMLPSANVSVFNEFASYGLGARHLLDRSDVKIPARFLLVSVGTGTSILLVEEGAHRRVGGTALGGGTLLGLATLIFGEADFDKVVGYAARGCRERVDLLVKDLYGGGIDELTGDLTAANFGKSENAGRDDIALGIVRLIGENIALIVGSLAALHGVKTIVYAGSTLRSNDPLKSVLSSATAYRGGEATFLKDGEYSGAVGAMLMAER